jgi:hypothetical protein
MSSRSRRELFDLDLINDLSEPRRDELPAGPESYPIWSRFWGGILTGIAGGALVPLGPWLGGALILAGYGMTEIALGKSPNRFVRALRFGFGVSAIIGAATFAGAVLLPEWTSSLIAILGKRRLIFCGVMAMPWAFAVAKYVYGFFR